MRWPSAASHPFLPAHGHNDHIVQVLVAGSVTLTGANAWKGYDPSFTLPPIQGTGDGAATVYKAGSYLLLSGAPNTTIKVSLAAP